MSDPARARKLADRIKVVVAEMLEKRIKDPRLGFVTITDSRVTNDLQHATLFYTVFGSDEDHAATAAALDSARGVLRSEVGRATGVRLTPTLTFVADAVPEHVQAIEDVLRQARERDAEVAALAAGKDFAGDADPYRRPEELVDDDGLDADGLDADGLDADGLDDDLDAELDEAASERVDGA